MVVTCESCKVSFKLDDYRIPRDGIKVRCSKCKHVFIVKRDVPDDFLSDFKDFETFHRDQMEKEALAVEHSRFGSKKGFLKIILPVLGGTFIGLLATMILKFMGGKFSF